MTKYKEPQLWRLTRLWWLEECGCGGDNGSARTRQRWWCTDWVATAGANAATTVIATGTGGCWSGRGGSGNGDDDDWAVEAIVKRKGF